MRKCELCNSPAKLFCESDQASLCWECDAKVHSANFLVTKHPRILLCHVCQSLTAWHGTGPKFVPTMSVCNTCVNNNSTETCSQQNHEDDDDDGTGEDHAENDDGGVAEDDDDDDDEENQVVPWTSTPPPPASTSSNSVTTSSTRFSDVEEGGSD